MIALTSVMALMLAVGAEAFPQSIASLQRDSTRTGPLLQRPARLLVRDVPIATALDMLGETAGVLLAYSPSMLEDRTDNVTCECECLTVAQALDQILAGTRTGYTEMRGHSPVSAVSDRDGRFRLANLTAGRHTVFAARIGYSRVSAVTSVRGGETSELEIRLAERTARLNDVVVTANKEENVQEIPYSISVISTEQIENAKITNTTDLTGVIPNVVTTFAATAGVSINTIRGVNDSMGGNQFETVDGDVRGWSLPGRCRRDELRPRRDRANRGPAGTAGDPLRTGRDGGGHQRDHEGSR